jgi:hypothetical protein
MRGAVVTLCLLCSLHVTRTIAGQQLPYGQQGYGDPYAAQYQQPPLPPPPGHSGGEELPPEVEQAAHSAATYVTKRYRHMRHHVQPVASLTARSCSCCAQGRRRGGPSSA